MFPPRTSLFPVVAGMLVLGGALAGCSSSSSTPTTSGPGATAGSTSTTTTAPATSTTTSTQPGPPPTCAAGELAVTSGGTTGAAGHSFLTVEIANKSATPCSLDGRPGVVLVGGAPGATPSPLPTKVLATGQGSVFQVAPATVTLLPGSLPAAGFLIQSSDIGSNGQQSCPLVVKIRVTLPGVAEPFVLAQQLTACGGPTISVSALVSQGELPAPATSAG